MWFAATYGTPQNRGGGSNLASWTRDGQILFQEGCRMPRSVGVPTTTADTDISTVISSLNNRTVHRNLPADPGSGL